MIGHGLYAVAGGGVRQSGHGARWVVHVMLTYGLLYCVPLTVAAALLTGLNVVTVGLMAVSVVLWSVDSGVWEELWDE